MELFRGPSTPQLQMIGTGTQKRGFSNSFDMKMVCSG
jgi:hypothetical protein